MLLTCCGEIAILLAESQSAGGSSIGNAPCDPIVSCANVADVVEAAQGVAALGRAMRSRRLSGRSPDRDANERDASMDGACLFETWEACGNGCGPFEVLRSNASPT